MRVILNFIIIVTLISSIVLLSSCIIIDSEKPLDGQDYGPAGVSEGRAKQDSNQKVEYVTDNRTLFNNSQANFSFIFPQESITVSSNPGQFGDYGDILLSISINALENLEDTQKDDAIRERDALKQGNFGPNIDFSFEPSRNIKKINDIFIKEFLVLERYDTCDIVFDWKARFYNNGYQVQLTLSANKEKIIESEGRYFISDEEGCNQGKAWGPNKQDKFYERLIGGQLSAPAGQWFRTYNEIIEQLQINDLEEETDGYKILSDQRLFEENDEPRYVIDAAYPQFHPTVLINGDDTINQAIYEDIVLDNVDYFKQEVSSYDYEEIPFNYFLAIDYSLIRYDEKGISLCMEVYPYLGGAHGMLYFETVNFDLNKKSLIELEEFVYSWIRLP